MSIRSDEMRKRRLPPACEQARDAWHDLRDEMLADVDSRRRAERGLESHLAQCAACAEYVRQMRGIASGLERLREQADAAMPPRPVSSVRRGWRLFSLAAGGIAAALFFALLLRLPSAPPAPRVIQPTPASDAPAREAITANSGPVELSGTTAERFMSVERPTSQVNVRVIELLPRVRPPENDTQRGSRDEPETLVASLPEHRSKSHEIR